MTLVTNRIAEVLGLCLKPETAPILAKRKIVVHRIQLNAPVGPFADEDVDALVLANAYRPGGPLESTGAGRMPYQLLVKPSGDIEQLLPLARVGAHAKGSNYNGIGVAVVGQHKPCSAEAMTSLVDLCQMLHGIGGGLTIYGHHSPTDDGLHLPGGSSSDPDKLCPEPVVSMAELRDRVVPATFSDPYLALRAAGAVID